MAIHELVTDYSVSPLRNDIVDCRRVLRLTTTSGANLFLAFPETPPADWLQFVTGGANIYLPAADFDATYRVLREQGPVFVTALNLLGLRAFSLDSGDEVPGGGPTDPEALVQLMERARSTTGLTGEQTAEPTTGTP